MVIDTLGFHSWYVYMLWKFIHINCTEDCHIVDKIKMHIAILQTTQITVLPSRPELKIQTSHPEQQI